MSNHRWAPDGTCWNSLCDVKRWRTVTRRGRERWMYFTANGSAPTTTRPECPSQATKPPRVVARTAPESPPAPIDVRSYALGDGRQVIFRLPEGGITTADVRRLYFHLLTHADDFLDEPAAREAPHGPA